MLAVSRFECMLRNITIITVRQILTELPTLVVCLGAIVAALVYWRRVPASSLCVLLACGLTAIVLVIWPVAFDVVVYLLGGSAQARQAADFAFRVFWSVVRAIATALLVYAVYAGRKGAAKRCS